MKIFDLTEEEELLIQSVKKENNLSSEVAALRLILSFYRDSIDNMNKEERLAERIYELMKNDLVRLRLSARTTEENTAILVDAINTMMFQSDDGVVLVDNVESELVEKSRENHRNKIAAYKQRKDNRV